jgi:hypothetical protein
VRRACATARNARILPLVRPANPLFPTWRVGIASAEQITFGRNLITSVNHANAMGTSVPMIISVFRAITGSPAALPAALVKKKQMRNLKFLLLLIQQIRRRLTYSVTFVSQGSITTAKS